MRTHRREILDYFLAKELVGLKGKLVDIGGERKSLRSKVFATNSETLEVTVVNISKQAGADIVCDASKIPVHNGTFDCALCLEVLEHVSNPSAVLSEASRILSSGGKLIISVPFLVGVHADPSDYTRWTDKGLESLITRAGFRTSKLMHMGGTREVVLDLIRASCYERGKYAWRLWRVLSLFLKLFPRSSGGRKSNRTTGYFVVAFKEN
jgi:SAM-dependent methyltransferase